MCYWDNCNVDNEFDTPDLLLKHIKDVHLTTVNQSDVVPIDRHYLCEWLGCGKQFGKKKLLLTHLNEHLGNKSDFVFSNPPNRSGKSFKCSCKANAMASINH